MSKLTFKEYSTLNESISSSVLKIAADLMGTAPTSLKQVSKTTEEKVLDTGREIETKRVPMAVGTTIVRIFKVINKLFARIETPNGFKVTYSN